MLVFREVSHLDSLVDNHCVPCWLSGDYSICSFPVISLPHSGYFLHMHGLLSPQLQTWGESWQTVERSLSCFLILRCSALGIIAALASSTSLLCLMGSLSCVWALCPRVASPPQAVNQAGVPTPSSLPFSCSPFGLPVVPLCYSCTFISFVCLEKVLRGRMVNLVSVTLSGMIVEVFSP